MFKNFPKEFETNKKSYGSDCYSVDVDYDGGWEVDIKNDGYGEDYKRVNLTLVQAVNIAKTILKINDYVKNNDSFYCAECKNIFKEFHYKRDEVREYKGKFYDDKCFKIIKLKEKDYKFKCPSCDGRGKTFDGKCCEVCESRGYTKEEMVRITEYKVKGK